MVNFTNQQTWVQPSWTCALFLLSSVHLRLALAFCAFRALGKSVESRIHPVSSWATLARDSCQMHSARVYSRHDYVPEKCVPVFSKVSEILFASSSTLFGCQRMQYPVIAYFSIFQFFCKDILNSITILCHIHLVSSVR